MNSMSLDHRHSSKLKVLIHAIPISFRIIEYIFGRNVWFDKNMLVEKCDHVANDLRTAHRRRSPRHKKSHHLLRSHQVYCPLCALDQRLIDTCCIICQISYSRRYAKITSVSIPVNVR